MDAQPEGSHDGASRPSSISSTLLDQLRARRPDAWQRLVCLYGPVTYRWCRRSNLTAEDAADVVQEVLSAVMVHLGEFRRDRPQDSFSGWLAAITRNKVREHYRRRHGKAEARGGSTAQRQMAQIAQPPEPSEESIQPDAQSAACLSRRVLEMIRVEFEARTWEAFWRVSIGGQSPAHVASDLEISVAAVYKAKSRVLGRFRQALSELQEQPPLEYR
ncbi:MAG: sigma-70 family RNA polymerase sigma factor [Thermoguttaceae bacterium]|jgi:RNA polymerase sigma-70 factor (ECF subfamily)